MMVPGGVPQRLADGREQGSRAAAHLLRAAVGRAGECSPESPPRRAAVGPRVLVGFVVTPFRNDPTGSFLAHLQPGRAQLGRSGAEPAPDISLADASASSRHATIHADPATGQAFIEDDGSRNGTFLNEMRLPPSERRQLRDNDRLRIGSMTLVVKLPRLLVPGKGAALFPPAGGKLGTGGPQTRFHRRRPGDVAPLRA